MLGPGAVVAPAMAAPGDGTLTLDISQKTGTGPFNADDAPGHDSGTGNNVVRTNDTIAYTVGIRFEGEDQTKPTIRFTLPQGQELVSMPPFCLAGSGATPTTLPPPVTPLTATSYQALPTQEIVCVVADQHQGTSLNYDFIAKVRPEMPHGTTMIPFKATATSDQVTTAAESPAVTQTVSAAPLFDLSKRNVSTTDNTGPFYQDTRPCVTDPTRSCRFLLFPLTLTTPSGGKGVSPIQSTTDNPVTFVDDVSPDALYGPGTTDSAAWLAAGPDAITRYGARIAGCDVQGQNPGGQPMSYSTGGYSTENGVRNPGSITCTQPGGPGTPIQYSIVGADLSAYTVPSKTLSGAAIQADVGYVISTSMAVEVPQEAVRDLGTVNDTGNIWTLNWKNTFSELNAIDLAGQSNVDPPANNTRIGASNYGLEGSFAKQFAGVPGQAGNITPCGFSACNFDGPPGASTSRDGNTVVVPGQRVESLVVRTFQIPTGSGTQFDRSEILCDVWDDSKLALAAGDYPAGSGGRQRIASGGDAAWISGLNIHGTVPTTSASLNNLEIQYSSGPAGAGADSECGGDNWFSSPDDVPGAVRAADGSYTGVNRVRASFSTESDEKTPVFEVTLAIGMQVRATAGDVGTVMPNWATYKMAPGTTDMDGVLAADPGWTRSNYVPATHVGGAGDRLILGAVTSRITKFVRTPAGTFDSAAVPQYTAGSTIDYRLNPSLTADVTAGTTDQVFVEDCLPAYQQFVSAHRETSGEDIIPALVQAGAPDGSELTCGPGETYLKWDLGQNEINKIIDPIVYTVEVLDTARNGSYINTTLVSSPGDPSAASLRDDTAQIQIVVPRGIKIAKSTPQNIVEVNPAGVATPRTLKWSVDFANVDTPDEVADVDVIDVLPANGIGDSDFTGDLAFTSAAVAAGTGIDILYTAGPSAGLDVEPNAPTNSPAGTTTWCSAPAGGAVVSGNGPASDCPASVSEVTGLRFLRAGTFAPEDAMTVDIVMTPSGNAGGDVYDNMTSGRAVGVSQAVGPASRSISIIESSVGNFVWEDLNSNGDQDPGEPPVPNFPVHLVGADLDGNPVNLSLLTDQDGKYSFDGLASGTYKLVFDPEGLGSTGTFTPRDVITINTDDVDNEVDSDGDTTTGETTEFALAPDSDDQSWDQGLIIDRAPTDEPTTTPPTDDPTTTPPTDDPTTTPPTDDPTTTPPTNGPNTDDPTTDPTVTDGPTSTATEPGGTTTDDPTGTDAAGPGNGTAHADTTGDPVAGGDNTDLPRTGGVNGWLVIVALLALMTGGALLVRRRSREGKHS